MDCLKIANIHIWSYVLCVYIHFYSNLCSPGMFFNFKVNIYLFTPKRRIFSFVQSSNQSLDVTTWIVLMIRFQRGVKLWDRSSLKRDRQLFLCVRMHNVRPSCGRKSCGKLISWLPRSAACSYDFIELSNSEIRWVWRFLHNFKDFYTYLSMAFAVSSLVRKSHYTSISRCPP